MLLTDIDALISNVNVTMGDAYLTGNMTDFFSPVKVRYSYGGGERGKRQKETIENSYGSDLAVARFGQTIIANSKY